VRLNEQLLGELHQRNLLEVYVTNQDKRSTNDLAEERTDLAARRTVMAADRSLMAWIRTALSMIGFGFTIYKLLQNFEESGAHFRHLETPRIIGLFLTGLGVLSMVMGTVEYWQTLKDLRQLQRFRIWRPSFVIALIMSAMGAFLFVSIIYRLF
jgi:putative membrane protein